MTTRAGDAGQAEGFGIICDKSLLFRAFAVKDLLPRGKVTVLAEFPDNETNKLDANGDDANGRC